MLELQTVIKAVEGLLPGLKVVGAEIHEYESLGETSVRLEFRATAPKTEESQK